jgi:hypothetical protein
MAVEGEGEVLQLVVAELVVEKAGAQEGMSEALVWVWVREAMAMVHLGDIFMSLGGQLALS